MKKILLFWLLLASSLAQAQHKVPVEIWDATTNVFSYSVTTYRSYSSYPLTDQGKSDFEQAVVAGTFSLTTTDGCIIPIGTRPPRTKPTCVTQPPSETVVQVAYNRTLGVKGYGSGTEYDKPGTVDGVIKEGTLTWTITDIPAPGSYTAILSYQSNTVVPTANFSVNNGSTQPLELTASGGQLRTATVVLTGLTQGTTTLKMTPSGYMTTASLQLTRTGSTTVTNPGSQTGNSGTLNYARVLIPGNSITLYPAPRSNWPGEPRGMAATAPNKDFVRLLTAKLQTHNPSVQVRTFADFASQTSNAINESTGPLWEANYWTTSLTQFDAVAAWQPDLIVMRLAENVTDPSHNFLTYYLALIDKLKSQSPNCKIVLTPSVWGQTDVTNAIATAASQRGYTYVSSLASMWTSDNDLSNPYYAWGVYADAGVNKHPNDAGMARIADAIYAALPSSSTVTNPPTEPGSSSGVVSYRADTFDYPSWPLASTANKFPVFENDNLKLTLALDNQKTGSTSPGGGGAIWKLVNKNEPFGSHGREHTLIYNPNRYTGDENGSVDRSGFPNRIFWGQGLSDCLYKLPTPLYADQSVGAAGPAHDPGLGLNPNECGDDVMNSGELQEYNVRSDGKAFHTKTRPPIYGQTGYYLPTSAINFEKWVQLSGRALKINYQANFNQTSAATYNNERVISKQQEAPCLWVNGMRRFSWYDGDSPYTNGSVTTIIAPQSGNGNVKGGTNNLRPGGQFVSENWIAVVGENGYGIGLILKHNYQAVYGYFGDGGFWEDNPHMGGSFGYIGQTPIEILDHIMKWRHECEVVVGTVAEIRAYAYSLAFRPDFTPKFKWNRTGRDGWSLNSGDGNDKHTWDDGWYGAGVVKNGWQINLGASAHAVISSPAVIWKAAETSTIYVKYKYSGNQTTWGLSFQRNAQKPNGAPDLSSNNIWSSEDAVRYRNGEGNGTNQTIYFTVIPDGQEHVAAIPVSGNSNWQGVINRINIRPHAYNDGRSYNANETVTLYWMNNQNADPYP